MADLPRWARPPAAALLVSQLTLGAAALAATPGCGGTKSEGDTEDTGVYTVIGCYVDSRYSSDTTSEDTEPTSSTSPSSGSGATSGTPTSGTGATASGTGPSTGSGVTATPARAPRAPALAPVAPPGPRRHRAADPTLTLTFAGLPRADDHRWIRPGHRHPGA